MFGFGYVCYIFFICMPCDFSFYADLINDRKYFHKHTKGYI